MDLLEIFMLIIGIVIIFISCRIVARPDNNKSGAISPVNMNRELQEELEAYKEQQSEILSSVSEETIAKTDDYLSKLSNEKIMAVSEYSDQILEKINQNHEEVVFLYNMLNNKEKELKDTVKVFDNSQSNTKELIGNKAEEVTQKSIDKSEQQLGEQAQKIRTIRKEKSEEDNTKPAISSNNAEILKKYKQGRSVLDIAKELGIGQGEVKLVVDLYKER